MKLKVSAGLRKGLLKLKQASPKIMLGTGVISAIAGTVLACFETTKIDDIRDEHEEELEAAKAAPDALSKVKQTYFRTIFKYVKLYLPSACCIILGFVMIFGSHSILQSRNALLSAELLSATQALNAYRDKVREKFGADVDGELMHEDKVEAVDKENKTFEDEALAAVEGDYIKYMSDDTSCKWVRHNMDMNLFIVTSEEQTANTKLNALGYLLLNDVLEGLGLPKTKKGYTHGWIVEPGKVKVVEFRPTVINGTYRGDEFILNKDGGSIRLDFNCDGYILDKIDLPEI